MLFLSTVLYMIILAAAFFYILPFYSQSLWWTILFFPSLLFRSLRARSFQRATTWSTLIAFGHFLPIGAALYALAHGPVYLKIIPGLVLIFLCTLYATIWLWATALLMRQTNNSFVRHACFIVSLWLFFVYNDQYLFWTWGRIEGNIFMNPLIPLLQSPVMRIAISCIGINPALFIFTLISSTYGLLFNKKKIFLLTLFIFFVPFDFKSNKPEWLVRTAHLPIQIPPESSCSIIAYRIAQLKKEFPALSLIILPESSTPLCPPFAKIEMIAGSFEPHQDYRYNTMYYLQGSETKIFHKRIPVPAAEYIPPILSYDWIEQLMFANTLKIVPSRNSRPEWRVNDQIAFTPYICSELFSCHLPDDTYQNTILMICNDLWFRLPHFKFLMASAARLRALQWHRPILYISYSYAQFFDEFGNIHPIATSSFGG